jgi:hypothetical protein
MECGGQHARCAQIAAYQTEVTPPDPDIGIATGIQASAYLLDIALVL